MLFAFVFTDSLSSVFCLLSGSPQNTETRFRIPTNDI